MSPSGERPLLVVGRIGRAHGLRGDVVVALTTTEASRLDPGTTLSALVPVAGGGGSQERSLVVRASRPHQKRWIVAFEGVTTREGAEALQGTELRAEPVDDDPDALWVHELIGAEVVDGEGTVRGRVEAVQDNPASDLLVLDTGHLVPLTFVVGWDERPSRLRVDAPAGLFDLG